MIEGGKYLSSRKNRKKSINKALENLKGIKKEAILVKSKFYNQKFQRSRIFHSYHIGISIIFYLWIKAKKFKQKTWSIISKLMQPKRIGCDFENSNTDEFKKVDASLWSLLCEKKLHGVILSG